MDVPAVSTAGTPYRRSVAVGMPRIPPEVLYSTFYLYPSVEAAKAGEKFGGTGFFVSYPTGIPEAPSLLYAVTNWHVAVRDGCSVMRVNTSSGVDIFDLDPSEWEFVAAGPDMAVVPHRRLGVKESTHQIIALSVDMLLTRDDIANLNINPGDDVFMIGRFVDHDGAASNVPSARFGNISVMPQNVPQPTGGKSQSFILDVHSRTGYSGSPVFVYRTFGSDLTTGNLVIEVIGILGNLQTREHDHFVKLLGLHWGQFPEQWEIKAGKNKGKKRTEAVLDEGDEKYIEGMSGMTLAIPGWHIREFLDTPKMVKERKEAISELLAARGATRGPIAESAVPPVNGENPTHREDFTHLLGAAAKANPTKKD
jgi:hypothetical protein